MVSRWEEYKSKNGVTPLDLLNPNTKRVSDEVHESRFKVCLECPELTAITHQCKKCGCFMNVKSKLGGAKCPLGKWKE